MYIQIKVLSFGRLVQRVPQPDEVCGWSLQTLNVNKVLEWL